LYYAEFTAKIGDDDYLDVTSESGAEYQTEVHGITNPAVT